MVKASSAAASQLTQHAQRHAPSSTDEHQAEGQRLAGRMRPAGIGRLAVRVITRVDVGVVPHVERAGGAGADGDRQDGDEAEQRIDGARRGDHADKAP